MTCNIENDNNDLIFVQYVQQTTSSVLAVNNTLLTKNNFRPSTL